MTRPIMFSFVMSLLTVAATSQTFKQHKIGETAQQFFAIATMGEHQGTLTTKFCADYLSNPKVQKAYERKQRNMYDVGAITQSLDVDGCKAVQQALDGKEVQVGAGYASEVGTGNVTFRDSKLVVMAFDVGGAVLEDAVADITKELGNVQPTMTVDTKQNGFGATLQARTARWSANNLTVTASEMKSFQYGNMGVSIIVGDSSYSKQKDAEREASRGSTIH